MQRPVQSAFVLSVAGNIVFSTSVLAGIAVLLGKLPGLGAQYVAASIGVFMLALVPIVILVSRHLHAARFGAANGVTLLRLALTASLAGLFIAPVQPTFVWICIGVATATLLLDGVDGKLARRYGQSSQFGARFDMEVDALLVLVLALLVWHFERAGIWVLAAGLLRYVFVAAAHVLPWLRDELPASTRRKTICILQLTSLLICLGPIIPPGPATIVAAAGVGSLAWSFALDIGWLYRHQRTAISA